MTISQPSFASGEGKRNCWITLENIKDSIVHDGLASPTDVDQILHDMARYLDDPSIFVTSPRIFQVIARK